MYTFWLAGVYYVKHFYIEKMHGLGAMLLCDGDACMRTITFSFAFILFVCFQINYPRYFG